MRTGRNVHRKKPLWECISAEEFPSLEEDNVVTPTEYQGLQGNVEAPPLPAGDGDQFRIIEDDVRQSGARERNG